MGKGKDGFDFQRNRLGDSRYVWRRRNVTKLGSERFTVRLASAVAVGSGLNESLRGERARTWAERSYAYCAGVWRGDFFLSSDLFEFGGFGKERRLRVGQRPLGISDFDRRIKLPVGREGWVRERLVGIGPSVRAFGFSKSGEAARAVSVYTHICIAGWAGQFKPGNWATLVFCG
jgi:hypothetical protein